MKKENIPVSDAVEDSSCADDADVYGSPRLNQSVDSKTLNSHLHHVKTNLDADACKRLECFVSPGRSRPDGTTDKSGSPIGKRSPNKTISPLKLEKNEGELIMPSTYM